MSATSYSNASALVTRIRHRHRQETQMHFDFPELKRDAQHATLATLYVVGVVGLAIIASAVSIMGFPQ